VTAYGTLVVELLTRAHRAGFEFRYLARPEPRLIVTCTPDGHEEPELRHIIDDLRRYRPDVLNVLARTCTIRTCNTSTWIREYGTDLPWCRPHAGTRGLMLLREEHPDLFPSKETAA
jgi:hypothetical protein